MHVRKAATTSNSEQAATRTILERQQELILELHDLLTSFGPSWYTREIDTRLNKTLAMSRSTNRTTH